MSSAMLTNLLSISPELLMTIAALLLIVIDVMASDKYKGGVGYFGIAFLAAIIPAVIYMANGKHFGFNNMLIWDQFSLVFFLIFSIAYALTTLGSMEYLKERGILKGEYFIIMFFSIIGMMFMVSAYDLTIFYAALETMAISMYILAGFNKKCQKSNEAGIKYFIIGAFSSGIFLFGLTYVYGFTGSTNYIQIAEALKAGAAADKGFMFGFVLMLVGFAFKISAVPFHMWAPDVYTGSPTPVAGFMTVAPKAAAIGGLIRFVIVALGPVADQWQTFFAILAVITMTYGNLVAIAQTNIKRMLAYSAISHAGYMMIGLVSITPENTLGYKAIAVYMLFYAFMNIGAFTILSIVKNKGMVEDERLESFAGFSKKYPLAGAAMMIFMLSLAGIPPLAGFMGKFYIFMAAIKSEIYWLAIIGVLNSAIAAYYYLRVSVYMYFREPEYDVEAEFKAPSFIGAFIALIAVLGFGMFPAVIMNLVKDLII